MKKKLDLKKIDRLSRVFRVPGYRKDRQFCWEFSLFSAQILGFSADFHRKWLNLVKQHSNNAGIWADSVF